MAPWLLFQFFVPIHTTTFAYNATFQPSVKTFQQHILFTKSRPRVFGFVALLVAELAVVSFVFDTVVFLEIHHFLGGLLGYSPLAMQIGITALVAMMVFGDLGETLTDQDLNEDFGSRQPVVQLTFLLSVQLISFLAWLQISHQMMLWEGAVSLLSVCVWALLAVATILTWCALIIPPHTWLRFLAQHIQLLTLCASVAIGAAIFASVAQQLWRPLAALTFLAVESVLTFFGQGFIGNPQDLVLGTQAFQVKIAPSCSGYEGIGLTWAFLGVYLWVSRRSLRFPIALLVIPIGTVLIWAANVIRISTLVAIGSAGFPKVAAGGFHSVAGWLGFNAVILGVVFATERFQLFSNSTVSKEGSADLGERNPSIPFLLPMFLIFAVGMVANAFSEHAGGHYGLRVLAAGVALLLCRRTYLRMQWSLSWHAIGIGVVVALMWGAIQSATLSPIPTETGRVMSAALVIRLLGYLVIAPFAEELAFRGYLSRRLISADFEQVTMGRFTWPACLISSVMFGAVHGANWLPGCLAGVLFFWAANRRGQLFDSVTAHMTANLLLASYAVVVGDWSLMS